jgi:hypothetical protein
LGIVFNPFNPTGLDFIGSGGSPASGPAERYMESFVVSTWAGPVDGYYIITVPQTTHGKTTNPNVMIFELNGSEYVSVQVQNLRIDASGNVFISVPASPDLRFAGLILIL